MLGTGFKPGVRRFASRVGSTPTGFRHFAAMMEPPSPIYHFGGFRYDSAQRLLFRGEQTVPLVPKTIDTLHALIERRGRVVEKAELMKLVWPDTTVEEIGLARNISALRKALGDEGGQAAFIETIPKRGYRFVAEVAVSGTAPTPPPRARRPRLAWAAASAAVLLLAALVYWQFYRPSRYLPQGAHYAALAVLPFDCLTPHLEAAAFPRGLQELLTAAVSKLDAVQVTSPSTVRRYREQNIPAALMARLLGLDVILEGVVQTHGENVRVTARLSDVHSGKIIWAGSRDYAGADLGAAQSAAARDIAAQAGAHLAPHR